MRNYTVIQIPQALVAGEPGEVWEIGDYRANDTRDAIWRAVMDQGEPNAGTIYVAYELGVTHEG